MCLFFFFMLPSRRPGSDKLSLFVRKAYVIQLWSCAKYPLSMKLHDYLAKMLDWPSLGRLRMPIMFRLSIWSIPAVHCKSIFQFSAPEVHAAPRSWIPLSELKRTSQMRSKLDPARNTRWVLLGDPHVSIVAALLRSFFYRSCRLGRRWAVLLLRGLRGSLGDRFCNGLRDLLLARPMFGLTQLSNCLTLGKL